MWRLLLSMWFLGLPGLALAAPPIATVTILDGDAATIIRDANKLILAEGVRLLADDIVEAGAKTRLVRIEFNDGVILDIGPDTRLLLAPRLAGERGKRPPKLYLLQGFAKLTAPKGAGAGAATLTSPAFDVSGLTRGVVLLVQPDEAYAFAESGDVSLLERSAGKEVGNHRLKSGDFFARTGDNKAGVNSRPAPAFIQRVPRPFLDTLPSRAELFKTREVEAKPAGTIAYADVQHWVDAETALRGGFVTRWRAQARNPEFRKGLVARMEAHPEWDRTLFPEKYLPKPPPSNPSGALPPLPVLPVPAKPYR
jgi:hypothetical protein